MTPEEALEAIISYCWTVSDDLKVDTNVIHNPEKILEIIHAQRAEAVAEAMAWRPIKDIPTSEWVLARNKSYGRYWLVAKGDDGNLHPSRFRGYFAEEFLHLPTPPAQEDEG